MAATTIMDTNQSDFSTRLGPYLICIITLHLTLIVGCSGDPPRAETMLEPEVDTLLLKVSVDKLRLRSAPSMTSETLSLLPEGAFVKYWNEHTQEKTTVTLRGTSITESWFLVSLGEVEGWVFGGALEAVTNEEGEDYIIVAGERVGQILAGDSEQDIIDRLGGDLVTRGDFMIGEGEYVKATFVYPETPKELILLWYEADFKRLHEIRIRRAQSPWTTEQGIKIGSTLREVEAINQSPFLLSGFEWDYAGSTRGWQDGILSEELSLVFDPPKKVHKALLGDQSIPSSHERMQAVDPKVKVIRVLFSST